MNCGICQNKDIMQVCNLSIMSEENKAFATLESFGEAFWTFEAYEATKFRHHAEMRVKFEKKTVSK